MRQILYWLRQHPFSGYVGITLTISWAIAIPLALSAQHLLASSMPTGLHYAISLGPLIGALILTAVIGGSSGLRGLLASLSRWRIGWGWWVVAVAPAGLYAIAAIVARLVEGTWPDLGRVGDVNFLGDIGVPAALLLWIATFGIGEETGWRGFALPHSQRRHSPLVATFMVGSVWAVWHAPLWFYAPGYRELGVAGVPGFLIGLLLGAILLTWVYNNTGGSVLAVAVWHALFDFFSGSQATDGLMNGVMSTVIVVWAVVILVATRGRLGRPEQARTHGDSEIYTVRTAHRRSPAAATVRVLEVP